MTQRKWPVWETVEIGTPDFRLAQDFLGALNRKDVVFGRYAVQAIEAMIPNLVSDRMRINLCRVKASDFGPFKQRLLANFLELAKNEGLLTDLPFETSVFLRIKYKSQPGEKGLHVAVKPVNIPKYGRCGLFLCENSLTGDCMDPGVSLMPEFECVFGVSIETL